MSISGNPFATLPPVRRACTLAVLIPARNEERRIGRTIEALATQCAIDGLRLDPATYEVIVYANNCTDDTAAAVRAVASGYPGVAVHVAEEWLPPNVAHIGTARRAVMNAAAARFSAAGKHDAILCATDADTVPAPEWLAWTVREMERADVVTGRILIDPAEWAALPLGTRAMLEEEHAYHFALAQFSAWVDPQPHDPWPRHWQRSGPSLAVRLSAYVAAGGVPPVRTLEDIALYDALAAAGARIRHSLRVRVTTSARLDARAAGGFGERISHWSDVAETYRPLLVEDPERSMARLRGEAVPLASAGVPVTTAVEATAAIRYAIACGVSDARATRSSVASIAG